MKKLKPVRPCNEPLFDDEKKRYFQAKIDEMKKRLDKKTKT